MRRARVFVLIVVVVGGLAGVVITSHHRRSLIAQQPLAAAMTPLSFAPGLDLPDAGTASTPPAGSTWPAEDEIDHHPVTDHAVTHSIFDDEDKVNRHPTGP